MMQGLMNQMLKRIFFVGAAIALVLASPGYSALRGTPFIPEVDQRFSDIEGGALDVGAISSADIADGTITATDVASSTGASSFYVKKYLQAVYDFGVSGGAAQAHVIYPSALPAGAIVTRSMLHINTKLDSSGASTFAVSCETANNIFTATDITFAAAGTNLEGAYFSAGASTVYKTITNACNLVATIGTNALTAGKVTIFIEYYVKS